MNRMKEQFMNLISQQYEIVSVDAGEYSKISIMGMDFLVEAYDVKGFGRLSWMSVEGMNGALKMDTAVFNALEKDLPLFSYDRIKAMGKDTLIVELYDTMIDSFDSSMFAPLKEKVKSLDEMPSSGPHWYDDIRYEESIGKVTGFDNSNLCDEVVLDYLEKFLEISAEIKSCDKAAKAEKAAEYSRNLVDQGGMAADNFVKTIGAEKTKEFFSKVLFGA